MKRTRYLRRKEAALWTPRTIHRILGPGRLILRAGPLAWFSSLPSASSQMKPLRSLALVIGILAIACRRPGVETASIETYTSPTTGFRFDVPSSWADHYRVERPDPAGNRPPAVEVVEFQYPPQDTSMMPQALFRVVVFTQDDWKALSAEEGPPFGWQLAERGGRVWIGGLPQSNPFTPGSADAVQFDKMLLSESQIGPRFRLP